MDYALEKKHEMVRTLFKEFAENEIKPFAQEVDEGKAFPKANIDQMAKYGFFGILAPEKYKGQGCDFMTYVICMEELAKVCGTTASIISAHSALCVETVLTYGTEEQKQSYIPELAAGVKLGAFGMEDEAEQETTAVIDEEEWILSGKKRFVINGNEAGIYLISASTGEQETSVFIIEKDTQGITVRKNEERIGNNGVSLCELLFDNCHIPKKNLLGAKGKGREIVTHAIDNARIGIAAQALGIAEGALERSIQYVQERKQFGKAIAKFQNTQIQLAEMATEIEAAQLMVYKAAVARNHTKDCSIEAAKAKLFTARVAMDVTTRAVQLHGGYGYMREYEVERMMREAKITEVYEGTAEEQCMVISKKLLK